MEYCYLQWAYQGAERVGMLDKPEVAEIKARNVKIVARVDVQNTWGVARLIGHIRNK